MNGWGIHAAYVGKPSFRNSLVFQSQNGAIFGRIRCVKESLKCLDCVVYVRLRPTENTQSVQRSRRRGPKNLKRCRTGFLLLGFPTAAKLSGVELTRLSGFFEFPGQDETYGRVFLDQTRKWERFRNGPKTIPVMC
jgi:hypothetical protein